MLPEVRASLRTECQSTFEKAKKLLAIPKRRLVSEWAEQERWIAQGASPLSEHGAIPYRLGVMPWVKEPMDSANDPTVQVSVLWWASGLAKTEVVVNVIGHSIHESPKNIFIAYPKDESRDKFSRDVLQRSLIDATPAVRELVTAFKSRDGGNTISYKRFAGGSVYMVGAGSPANFRGPRAGVIYCDEIDGMPDDVGGEGDPITLAFKRSEGFANSVKFLSGTGTFKPKTGDNGQLIYRSRIHKWYDLSDKRKWFCPCRKCGHQQVLRFEQIRAIEGKPEVAYYLCEQCDADHSDKQRVEMVMQGEWRPTAAFSGVRGYWLNGVNSTLPAEKGFSTKIHQFVADAERSQKDPNSKRVWINTFQAELDDPDEQTEAPPDQGPLMARRESYADGNKIEVPQAAMLITAAVDVQVDRLEVLWTAWGRNEESWVLDHEIIGGHTQDERVWKQLEQKLTRAFTREDGATMTLQAGFVDAGKWPDWVLYFLNRLRDNGSTLRGKVRACRGSSQYPHPLIDVRITRIIKGVYGHWIGGDAAKDLIYARLRRPIPEDGVLPDGWQHFPKTVGERFFEQLTSERVTVTYARGEEIRRYTNKDRLRNEILDLSVYSLAAFRVRKWDFDATEAEREEQLKAKAAPQQQARTQATAPRRSFATAW